MKTIISESKQVHENAARRIKALLDEKPDAVIAFSAGRSMTVLFALLREMSARREVCFSAARVLAVTEFISAPPALTCRAQLERELLDPVGTVSGNRYFPSEENFRDYDALIASLGGIDLAVIGIGHNGHIGYNEPGTQFDTLTRVQILAPATRRQLADEFGGEDKVPERAVTMGIKTITDARDIAVLALGREKAGAVFQMLSARDDSVIPAAFLQIPMNVEVFCDKDASSML